MVNAVNIYLRDFGGERVGTGIPTDVGATAIEKQALVDAIQAWSIGQPAGADNVTELEADTGVGATSPVAQSGMFAYILMKDNVNGKTYRERIPMPHLGKAVDVGGELAWLAESDSSGNSVSVANPLHADYLALQTAIEAVYLSPEGNTGVLTRVFVPNKF